MCHIKNFIALICFLVFCAVPGMADDLSRDVTLNSYDPSTGTLVVDASGTATDKKDAKNNAVYAAFDAIIYSGITGVKDGSPLVMGKQDNFDYDFYQRGRYVNYLGAKPKDLKGFKVADSYKENVRVTIKVNRLLDYLKNQGFAISPLWSGEQSVNPIAALAPTIMVVPYLTRSEGESLEDMARKVENDPNLRYALDKMTQLFGSQGYKTRDFETQLRHMQDSRYLQSGTQADAATRMAQQLPADVLVYVTLDVVDNGNTSHCTLTARAVENQTAGTLGSGTFASGEYRTSNYPLLIDKAGENAGKEFFRQIKKSFEYIVNNGHEINLQFTLSNAVRNWDFDEGTPTSSTRFKVALEDWLRKIAVRGSYDMTQSTSKYIKCRINIPLWNQGENKSYTISNFSEELRTFLEKELGPQYKCDIANLGQAINVEIE